MLDTQPDRSSAQAAESAATTGRTARPAGNRMVHPAVLLAGAACYVWIMGVFAVVLGGTPQAAFMITVAVLFLGVYLGLPGVMAAMREGDQAKQTLGGFLDRPLEVWTGRVPGRDAAMQVILVPLALAGGITAMGIIIALVRSGAGL